MRLARQSLADAGRFNKDRLPDPKAYYRRELGETLKTAREAKDGWVSARCCFHDDDRPSLAVNLKHGGWRCFGGCGRGDLIAFHMKRHGLSFVDAAKALGAWA